VFSGGVWESTWESSSRAAGVSARWRGGDVSVGEWHVALDPPPPAPPPPPPSSSVSAGGQPRADAGPSMPGVRRAHPRRLLLRAPSAGAVERDAPDARPRRRGRRVCISGRGPASGGYRCEAVIDGVRCDVTDRRCLRRTTCAVCAPGARTTPRPTECASAALTTATRRLRPLASPAGPARAGSRPGRAASSVPPGPPPRRRRAQDSTPHSPPRSATARRLGW